MKNDIAQFHKTSFINSQFFYKIEQYHFIKFIVLIALVH